MKKKILLTMFVVCMTLIFFSCYVSATETGTMSGVCGAYGSTDVTWRYDGEGTLTISGSGSMLSYRYDIDTPGWPSDIKYVIIENGVTSIGSYAFRNHTSLESITIADSVTGIGIGAFKGCSSLVNVRLSNGLIAIGPNVFWGCSSLAFIALPDSVQSLGSNDFQQRTEIHNLFRDCTSLSDITVGAGNEVYSSKDGVLFNKAQTTLLYAPAGKTGNYSIPDGTKSIDWHAFYQSQMTGIVIPKSVKSMGWGGGDYYSFEKAASLSDITVDAENPDYMSKDGILFNKLGNRLLYCPEGKMGTYHVPDSVVYIDSDAFYQGSLTEITVSDSVKYIGYDAFGLCRNLAKVTLSNRMTNISGSLFAGCSNLIKIEIPDCVTSIGAGAFQGCSSLEEITIPEGVKSIYADAFKDCSSLKEIALPDSVKSIGTCAFQGCSSLERITIPEGVKSIETMTFEDCSSLMDIYYSGNESDWESIDKASSVKNDLAGVAIHYNSKWNFFLFQSPSTKYNNRLALIAADMSEKVEEGEDAIRALYDSYDLTDCEYYNFDESAAFAIGQTALTIDGINTMVLVITVRGTKTNEETIGDWLKGFPFDKTREFLGQTVWTHVYEFEEKISEGLNSYVARHPALEEADNLKILVTGHSLGGAAANMAAARFTRFAEWGGWWSKAADKEDIYAYTFGAIKVIDEENKNISDGYENIHNIYNYYDSFGPNGNMSLFNASAIKAKFGHTELYYLHEDEKLASCNNHLMSNYKKALEQNMVSCSEKARAASKARIEKLEKDLSGIWQNIRRMISQVAVLCPVDVEIYASDGSLAGSVTDNEVAEMASDKVYICIEGDKKYIYLLEDDDYTMKLRGTDAGTMTYSVQNIDMDTGEVMEEKTFVNVTLTAGKAFAGSVKVEENIATEIAADEIRLFVVKDNGEPEKEVLADGSGTETAVSEKPQEPGTDDGTGTPDGSDSTDKQPDEKNPGGGETDKKDSLVKVNKIKISGISKKIAAGKKITLKAAVSPSNAANKSITWKSDNKKYASVNSRGIVTLKKAGAGKTVTITAAAKDGSGKKASCKIKIMKGAVKEVKISGKTVRTAKSGTSVKLKASVKASDGANKALQWKSSNTRYASVNGKGKVALKKAGKGKTVKITAMATDGSGKKAAVKIKIK